MVGEPRQATESGLRPRSAPTTDRAPVDIRLGPLSFKGTPHRVEPEENLGSCGPTSTLGRNTERHVNNLFVRRSATVIPSQPAQARPRTRFLLAQDRHEPRTSAPATPSARSGRLLARIFRSQAFRSVDRRKGVGTMFDSSRFCREERPGSPAAGSLTSHENQKALRSATRAEGCAQRKRELNRDESKPEPSAILRSADETGMGFDGEAPCRWHDSGRRCMRFPMGSAWTAVGRHDQVIKGR